MSLDAETEVEIALKGGYAIAPASEQIGRTPGVEQVEEV